MRGSVRHGRRPLLREEERPLARRAKVRTIERNRRKGATPKQWLKEIVPLTAEEREQYEDAKTVICGYASAYYTVVGQRLVTVEENTWFREEFPNFDAFCRWAIGAGSDYGYRLINAAKVHACLLTIVNTLPANECQARPLTVLLDRPELLIEVWQTVLARCLDGKITGEFVKKVVKEYLHPMEPDAAPADPAPMVRDVALVVHESREGTLDAAASRWPYTHEYVSGRHGVIPPPVAGYRGGEREPGEAEPDHDLDDDLSAEDLQEELVDAVLSWMMYSGPENAAAVFTQRLPAAFMRELVEWINQSIGD